MDYCLLRINELLEEYGWTMYQLSKKAGIPQSTLSNLFIRNNAPTIPTLEKLCDAFGITLGEFFSKKTDLGKEESELLSHWKRLSSEAREALLKLIKELCDK
ncbi:MAG: helix-turn-helix transcriptional regulator [Clostridia bacterium]|nr:helix-turn-helix transcriptional regulator [Clostridia bacterium]